MRLSPIDAVAGKLINFYAADDVQKHQLGLKIAAVDSDYLAVANIGNAGGCEVVYAKGTAAFTTGRLVHVDKDFNILDVPVTGNTGRPVYVCLSSFSATAQFGWLGRAGAFPVSFSVAATAGPVFAGAAGQATPTAAAGRQLLNATTLLGSAAAFTRSAKTVSGSPTVTVGDSAGVFPGQTISGAGIPAATTILSISEGGSRLTLSANSTASGQITATFTNTGFGIVQVENAFVQGQIT